MYLYSNFCDETLDERGVLQDFSLHYPDNYNFCLLYTSPSPRD